MSGKSIWLIQQAVKEESLYFLRWGKVGDMMKVLF